MRINGGSKLEGFHFLFPAERKTEGGRGVSGRFTSARRLAAAAGSPWRRTPTDGVKRSGFGPGLFVAFLGNSSGQQAAPLSCSSVVFLGFDFCSVGRENQNLKKIQRWVGEQLDGTNIWTSGGPQCGPGAVCGPSEGFYSVPHLKLRMRWGQKTQNNWWPKDFLLFNHILV